MNKIQRCKLFKVQDWYRFFVTKPAELFAKLKITICKLDRYDSLSHLFSVVLLFESTDLFLKTKKQTNILLSEVQPSFWGQIHRKIHCVTSVVLDGLYSVCVCVNEWVWGDVSFGLPPSCRKLSSKAFLIPCCLATWSKHRISLLGLDGTPLKWPNSVSLPHIGDS